MSFDVTCAAAEDTRALAQRLAGQLAGGDLVLLIGPLGAGKTTFVQGLARGLGITGPVTSPTFVLARELRGGRLPLVHVDAYRVASGIELDDLDLDSDLADAVLAVEWGEGLAERLADSRLDVTIDRAPDTDTRLVRIDAVGPRWAALDPDVLAGPVRTGA